jgi:hypothetical protein
MSESPFSPSERQPPSGDGRALALVPHNREAEEAVLGAVLVSPETYFDLVHTLSPDDFFLHRNRWVWEAFTSLQEQRLPIDVLTVSEELERQDRLQEVGGPAYLATLIHNVPSTLNAGAYALLVQESATRRRLLEAANAIARLAHANDTPIEDVVGDSEKAVFAVSERRLTRQLLPIRTVLSAYYDRIDTLAPLRRDRRRPDRFHRSRPPAGGHAAERPAHHRRSPGPGEIWLLPVGGAQRRPGPSEARRLVLARDVERAGCAAVARSGDVDRLPAPAARQRA